MKTEKELRDKVDSLINTHAGIYTDLGSYGTDTSIDNTNEAADVITKLLVPKARPYTEEELDKVHEDVLLLDKDMKPTSELITYSTENKCWWIVTSGDPFLGSTEDAIGSNIAEYFIPLSELNFR